MKADPCLCVCIGNGCGSGTRSESEFIGEMAHCKMARRTAVGIQSADRPGGHCHGAGADLQSDTANCLVLKSGCSGTSEQAPASSRSTLLLRGLPSECALIPYAHRRCFLYTTNAQCTRTPIFRKRGTPRRRQMAGRAVGWWPKGGAWPGVLWQMRSHVTRMRDPGLREWHCRWRGGAMAVGRQRRAAGCVGAYERPKAQPYIPRLNFHRRNYLAEGAGG